MEADVDVVLAAVTEALLTRLVTAILHSSHCLSILSNILRAPVFVAVKQTKCKTLQKFEAIRKCLSRQLVL